MVQVIEFSKGLPPPHPEESFYTNFLMATANGAKSTLRTQTAVTIGGYKGFEAVSDREDGKSALMDVVIVNNRIFLIMSAGGKEHSSSANALDFRDSFRLLDAATSSK